VTALDRNEQIWHPTSELPPRPSAALWWLAQLRPVQHSQAGEHSRRIGQYVEALEQEVALLRSRDSAAVEAGQVVTAVVAELDRVEPGLSALEREAARMGAEADQLAAAGSAWPSPVPRGAS
jgi:hypothetical protein